MDVEEPFNSSFKPRLSADRRGIVYVEFVIVFFPVFLMFLAIVQLSFFYAAKLTVQHAAYMGARSAIVVLDDDPKHYEGAPRNCLEGSGDGDQGFAMDLVDKVLRRIASGVYEVNEVLNDVDKEASEIDSRLGGAIGRVETENYDPEREQDFEDFKKIAAKYRSGNPRLQAIRSAVYVPLITLAPDLEMMRVDSVRGAIGNPWTRELFGFIYNLGAASVTFPGANKENIIRDATAEYRTVFNRTDVITVRVNYMFHCSVPLVSYLMCQNIYSLLTGIDVDKLVDTGKKMLNADSVSYEDIQEYRRDVVSTIDDAEINNQQDMIKELRAAEHPGLSVAFGILGGRFKALRAEVSLPNQGAVYKYEDEEAESCSEYAEGDAGGEE